MNKLILKIHPSMRIDGLPHRFEGEFEGVKIIEAIDQLLKEFPNLHKLCLENGKNKPGLLFFSDKTELTSMGLLDETITSDIEIRIVPILHGG